MPRHLTSTQKEDLYLALKSIPPPSHMYLLADDAKESQEFAADFAEVFARFQWPSNPDLLREQRHGIEVVGFGKYAEFGQSVTDALNSVPGLNAEHVDDKKVYSYSPDWKDGLWVIVGLPEQ